MESGIVDCIIHLGHRIGPELISLALLNLCYASILLLWRFFSFHGLYLYNIVAVIVANIQVLKTTPFISNSEPMALGTIVFASTFLVSDIITEHSGAKVAQTGIKLTFFAQILITLFMIITLAYPSSENLSQVIIQKSLYSIFAPSFRILTASLLAYYFSQLLDVAIFNFMKKQMHGKMLWLRINVSTLISGFVDNVLFSTLAWVILSPTPVSFEALIFTYIFGTYVARVVVSITSTPIIYLSHKIHPKANT